MRFYSIAPESLRDLQDPDPGEFLKHDGGNAAAVLRRLRDRQPDSYERVCWLLAQAVEGVESVEPYAVGTKETLQFRQDIGLKHPWTFEPVNMSDGTLRLLGLLLAVYQLSHATLIGIEEPESTVHPAVSELVLEVLRDATRRRQIVVTTHSPDILDSKDLLDDQILAVTKKRGSSVIAGLAPASRKAIRERIYTAGELLRADELAPDVTAARREAEQAQLFPSLFERRSSPPTCTPEPPSRSTTSPLSPPKWICTSRGVAARPSPGSGTSWRGSSRGSEAEDLPFNRLVSEPGF